MDPPLVVIGAVKRWAVPVTNACTARVYTDDNEGNKIVKNDAACTFVICIIIISSNVASRSRLVVSASDVRCDRTQVRITPRPVVFIATAAATYSLGHGLRIFAAVPRSTQPSTLREKV